MAVSNIALLGRACIATTLSMAGGDFVCQIILRDRQQQATQTAAPSSHPSILIGATPPSAPLSDQVAASRPRLPVPDAAQALLQEHVSGVKLQRVVNMAATGATLMGPWSFAQFLVAERLFPGSAMRAVMSKVALGVCVAPLAISTAFTGVLFYDGKGAADVQAKLQSCVVPTWTTGLAYWPLVSVVMFRFVPFAHRATAGAMFGALWNIYLSFRANSDSSEMPQS